MDIAGDHPVPSILIIITSSLCSSSNACRFPRSRPCIPFSSSRNCINDLPYSEPLVTKIYSEGLLLLPIPSVPPSNLYEVTSSTLYMNRIFSLTGFVFSLFQSLMPLYAIPVFSENSYWLIPHLSSSPKISSDIIICSYPFRLKC